VEVADYRAVFSAARLNTAITSSFSTLFLPVIARFYARGDIDGLRQSYWHTAVFVAVLTFPIFAMTVPFASATTVALFGEKYAEAGPVMLTLALGYYVSAILGFNAYVLQVCERIRFLVGVNVFAAVLNVGLCLLLAPRFAAVGVAAAHTTVMVTQNLLNQWALRGAISTRFLGSGYRRCYAWIAGVTVALGVIQVVFSPGIVLACLVAGVAFLLVLVGTRRELKLGETFPELQRIPVVRRLVGR
jgi:O-antigen/teichoic acid export membrane protein